MVSSLFSCIICVSDLSWLCVSLYPKKIYTYTYILSFLLLNLIFVLNYFSQRLQLVVRFLCQKERTLLVILYCHLCVLLLFEREIWDGCAFVKQIYVYFFVFLFSFDFHYLNEQLELAVNLISQKKTLKRDIYLFLIFFIYACIYVYIYIYSQSLSTDARSSRLILVYGVATISRMLWNRGLFAEYRSLCLSSFAKETYIFKHATNRSHPIGDNEENCSVSVNIVS